MESLREVLFCHESLRESNGLCRRPTECIVTQGMTLMGGTNGRTAKSAADNWTGHQPTTSTSSPLNPSDYSAASGLGLLSLRGHGLWGRPCPFFFSTWRPISERAHAHRIIMPR